jgi:thiol:disulfide interchange protein
MIDMFNPAKYPIVLGCVIIMYFNVLVTPMFFVDNVEPLRYKGKTQIDRLVKEHNGVLMEITADWCGYCKANKQYLFSLETIKFLLDNDIVIVEVNSDLSGETAVLMQELRQRTIPAYYLILRENKSERIKLNIDLEKNSIPKQLKLLGVNK